MGHFSAGRTMTTNLTSLRSFLSKSFSSSSTSFSVPSHDHIARLILDQKSPSQALQTFKWASDLPSFTHSQSTYRALIQKLCAFRRFDNVNNVLDEMPSSIGQAPDDGIFLTIIRGLGRAHRVRDVFNFLDLVFRSHRTPSLKIFNSVLDVLVKENIDLAREFYRKKMMASGVQGDDYTFGILMKGLCSTNRIGDGFKLLQIIKSSGATPNIVIYNTLIHALCKNGKVGRARSLMNEIKETNDVTFNILISAYCKEDNLVQALVLLEKRFNLGFVPDVVTVTKVLQVLCNAGRMSEAVEILERVESKGGTVDVLAYNTLIKGFRRLGKVKVGRRLLKEMEHKGCLPNVETYNTLISGLCKSGMLDSALDMFEDMKTDGISWNFGTYDALIRGLCSKGKMEDGLRILELMEETKGGSGGRISPYNSVLYGFYKANSWEGALDFLHKMERLFPRAVDRSLRTLRFCEEGNLQDARGVYDQMNGEGGIPSVLVFDCLIHGFCQLGDMKEAIELMNEMVAHDYIPNASTFTALVSAFCRQGKARSGLKLMEDMIRIGCVPDTECYGPLIEALCMKGDFGEALALLLQMIEKGIIPNSFTWNSLLVYLGFDREWLESKEFSARVNSLLQTTQ